MKEVLKIYCEHYGINLSEEMLDCFARYEEMLLDWNSRMNLTAITDREGIAVKHFLDSLLLLKAYDPPDGARLLDVGSGAGFPAMPLKIVRPDLTVTMLDSLQKRIGFLQAVADELKLSSAFLHGRAEDWANTAEHREQFDIVTARAVASMGILSEYCLPYVAVGGCFIALKGASAEEELQAASNAIRLLGGKLEAQQEFTLPDGSHRAILTIRKISQSPLKYPRTPNKITKAPL